MKYSIIFVIVIIIGVVFFLISCKSQKKVNHVTSAEMRPLITLTKSRCFGKCKVYKLQIYEDKTVVYEGLENVEKIGVYSTNITDKGYRTLISLFENIDFKNLESTYLTGVRDKQKITIGYSQKEVKYENRAASEELKQITKEIDDLINKMEWNKN